MMIRFVVHPADPGGLRPLPDAELHVSGDLADIRTWGSRVAAFVGQPPVI